jgi:hypothetical protein
MVIDYLYLAMHNTEQPDLLKEIPVGKIYSRKQIFIGTVIGGLLVSAYLLSSNFKVLNERGKVVPTWIILMAILALFVGSAFVPGLEKLPSIFFVVLGAIIAGIAYTIYQSKKCRHILTIADRCNLLPSWYW